MKRKLLASSILAASLFGGHAFAADDTIKVGVLHSLSGTMAISETTLKDTMLMLIDEQNKKGGLLGKNWSLWWLTLRQTGRCSLKKRVSWFKKTKSLPFSAAGLPFPVNQCCQ